MYEGFYIPCTPSVEKQQQGEGKDKYENYRHHIDCICYVIENNWHTTYRGINHSSPLLRVTHTLTRTSFTSRSLSVLIHWYYSTSPDYYSSLLILQSSHSTSYSWVKPKLLPVSPLLVISMDYNSNQLLKTVETGKNWLNYWLEVGLCLWFIQSKETNKKGFPVFSMGVCQRFHSNKCSTCLINR